MKPISKLRFAGFVLWVSICCIALMSGMTQAGAMLGLSWLFFLTAQEAQKPVSKSEMFRMVPFLLIFIVAIVIAKYYLPNESGKRWVSDPVVVVPVWILYIYCGFRRLRSGSNVPSSNSTFRA